MTKRELLIARQHLRMQIGEVDQVMHEIALSGFATASISSGGASKAYTRQNIGELREYRQSLVARLGAVLSELSGYHKGFKRIMITRF